MFSKNKLPKGSYFVYPSQVAPLVAYTFVLIVIGASALIAFESGLTIMGILICFWFLLSLAAAYYSVKGKRDVMVNDDGIYTILFDRIWKFIAWREVNSIEQERIRMSAKFGHRRGHNLYIKALNGEIIVGDEIYGLPNLQKELNNYAQQFQIPITYVDYGQDTRDKINATVKDKAERKRILKKGVRTPLNELKEVENWGNDP